MKFICNTKDIAAAVNAASKVVNGQSPVPILSNVKLTAANGTVTVRATDLDLTLEKAIAAEIEEDGAVTIPAKLFAGYLTNLPIGILELTGSPTRASIRVERSIYDFLALPPDEFPTLPETQKSGTFTISARTFREAVSGTVFAASNEVARGAVLMGTMIEIEGDKISMVATDGYRLAKWVGRLESNDDKNVRRYIVPSRALAEAARNIDSEILEISVLGKQSNQLAITGNSSTIVVRLIDGQYPNWQQVMPQAFDLAVTVNSSALMGALRRAQIMSGESASLIKITIADGHMIIAANSDLAGNAYEDLEAEQSGKDITMAFNARLLIEILNHIDSPLTMLEFVGPFSPLAIHAQEPGKNSEQVYILMPLRQ